MSAELTFASASELARAIRSRELSPVEVLDDFAARIEQRNTSVNAFVFLDLEQARERAREAERAVVRGAPLGPLHGVPTAMKDLFDFKPGWPATFGGIPALKDFVLDAYCGWAERMEAAGAIILGKTNSPVMGFRGTCDNPLFGPSCNPFDTTRNTGGSSGGSAAAVADALVPFGEGTDAGGSVRIPASWCGVYGFIQSFGRAPLLPRPNAFSSINPFIFEGVISRTVEDAALALSALTGPHPRDPLSFPFPDEDLLGALRGSIRGWRVAYSPDFGGFPVEPAVSEVVAQAAHAMEEAGAHVEEVAFRLPRDQRELSDLLFRVLLPANVQAIETLKTMGVDLLGEHRDQLPPQYLRWLEQGYRLTALDMSRDQEVRTEVFEAIQDVFADHDLLITPTLACLAVKNATDGNTVGPSTVNGVSVDELVGWCLTYPVNFTGHPAASVPVGLAAGGLPVGMQIIGRRHADRSVLCASAVLERVRPWRDTYQRAAQRPLS
ncbi:MAG: amidase [Solirubrobacteraceae bacterium]